MTASTKRVMFTLPSSLLEQVDEEVEKLETNRSSLIREALEYFMADRRRRELREALKEGYLYHAERDQRICEEFAYSDYEVVSRYAPYDEEDS
jgi:CopG family transcriptional regulator/antitoxin EndoAI